MDDGPLSSARKGQGSGVRATSNSQPDMVVFVNNSDDIEYIQRLVLEKVYHIVGCGKAGERMVEASFGEKNSWPNGVKVSSYTREMPPGLENYHDPYGHPPLPTERGESDEPERGESDEPERGESDEPERGESDEPERGESDEPERGESDEPERGESDEPEREGKGGKVARGRKRSIISRIVGIFRKKADGSGPDEPTDPDEPPDAGTGGGAENDANGTSEHQRQVEGYLAYRELRMEVAELMEGIKDTDVLITVSSLEDEPGIENTRTLCEIAREKGSFNILILSMPRKIRKVEQIEELNKVMQELRLLADVVIAAPWEEKLSGDILLSAVTEIIHLIDVTGVVNLDLADVKTTVKGGKVALIGYGVSELDLDAPVRAVDAFRSCLKHPMFNIDILSASRVLVNVSGGRDLSLGEAEGVIRELEGLIERGTRVIWGVVEDSIYKGRVHVFLMVGVTPKEVLVRIYATC